MSQTFVVSNQIHQGMLKMIERFFLKQDDKLEKVKSIRINGYTLNPITQKLMHKRKKIDLRRKEFEILCFMFLNRKSIIDRNTILERVWGLQSNPFTNTVDVHMSHLRKKLTKNGINIIKTIYGVGYKLEI